MFTVDSISQDLRYGFRSLRRTPGLTAAAVVTLALGIGANTAIFSVIDAVLLKAVPVSRPNELFFLAHGTGDNPGLSSTYPLYERYRGLTDIFAGVTAYLVQEFKVSTADGPHLVTGQFVAGKYHDVLGVPFILGRGFTNESDRPGEHSLVAVISAAYWSRAFGRDPNVLGKRLTVEGRAVSIVGVTAEGFHGLRPGTQFDVTLPLAVRVMSDPAFLGAHDTWTGLNIVARLQPDATEPEALARVDAVFQQYMALPEQAWIRRGGRVPDGLRMARLVSADRGTPALRRQYDRALRTLMAMVGVFLLIACANVANLMLAKASARAKEVAIRSSLGASRSRLVRQFLIESLLLAAAGGALGLLLAPWATTAIVSLFRVGHFPVLLEADPDSRVVIFAAAISMVTGIVFGIAPALRGARVDVSPALKESSAAATSGPRRLRAGRALAVCQIALCVVLLAATGLLVRTLYNLKTLNTGFLKNNVLLFYVDTRGTNADLMSVYPGVLERLSTLSGVRSASFSQLTPLATDTEERGLQIPGMPLSDEMSSALTNRITPDYFATFGIAILRGRALTPHDSPAAQRVAVVNETFARTYFGTADALGRTFVFRSMPRDPVTIVGIARDVRHQTLREPPARMVYIPLAQAEESPPLLTAAIRTTEPPRALETAVRDAVRRQSPDLTISYVRTMEEQIDASLVRERVLARLSAGFGLLALLLACIGLYGVVSYGVARRAREISIRIALGAQHATVLWNIIRETLAVCAAGLIIGLAATLAATRLVSTFLFGLSERDPATLLGTIVLLALTALLAGYLPARRAARIDPMRALRVE